ncbi:hypothetical protein [Terasakiella sp. SH-1]|uniref:hypothetical protein n=1 Tax=Terasakiella sp. SH-1 TaxID=2560057 RepID=UPI00107387AE|nr:hypothetical protein [Terasakiella sp. SH-1]
MGFFLRAVEDKPINQYTRHDILDYIDKLEQLPSIYGKSPKYKTMTLEEVFAIDGDRMSITTLDKHFKEI